VLHRLPRRARRVVRGAILIPAVTATLLLVPSAGTLLRGQPIEWRRDSGSVRYAWGVSGRMYYYYSLTRHDHAGPLPGETGSASKGDVLAGGSFGPFNWVHSTRDNYYAQGGPGNDLDISDLSRYRRVRAETRADYWLDVWDTAAVLLLPGALALLNALRRYVVHGYWFAGAASEACHTSGHAECSGLSGVSE
jgi:hypothetical protein